MFAVGDPAREHMEAEEPATVVLLVPAELVALVLEFKGSCRLKFESGALGEFLAEPVYAAFCDNVFEPGMLAVGAVAEVAMDLEDGFGGLDEAVFGDIAHDIAEPGIGFGVVVAHAEPAAGEEVVTDELAVFLNGDVAKAVGEDVRVVQRGDGEGDLKLSGEVSFAIERIHEIGVWILGGYVGVLEPDFMVGPGDREKRIVDVLGVGQHLIREGGGGGGGGGHDVAVDVSAGGERGGQHLVHALDQGPQSAFDYAVELEALARGDPERVIAVEVRELVESEVLVWGDHTAGQTAPDHENPLLSGFAKVAVVLLVDAVKLQVFVIVVGKPVCGGVGKRAGDIAGQGGDGGFESFVPGGAGLARLHIHY